MPPNTAQRRRPDGPNAGVLAIVSLVLSLAAIAVPAAIAGGRMFVSPLESTAAVYSYITANRTAIAVTGFFVFGASVPLGIYAATAYARLQRLGIRVPGPNIAFYGGIAASILLGASGLSTWALGQPVAGQSPALLQTIDYVVYALGGVGFVGGLGLLIAGIAVPSLILRLTPSWLAWTGLILAGLSELSFVSLLLPGLAILLPIGRFAGLAWLVVVGFMLPRNRHDVPVRNQT
ncbi:MAG: hypothetical protein EPN48_17845 [Microbacteriaceae bacterium]|nr:MAG: hypothetical protein EPN48_17845 [Microbacteriaceae bacterium]